MKQKKLIVCVCLATVLVLLLPHAVFADTAKSGDVTDTITWELTDDGVLYIRGTGEIPDYGDFYKNGNRASDPSPWELWHDEIKELVIEEGITRIGERAFADNDIEELYGYYNLTKVTLPRTLVSVGLDAFCEASYSIEEVHAPSLLDWCEIAFEAETPGDPPLFDSNPALYADLYVGGELLTGRVEFPKELTKVNSLTFAGREGLTEVVLHNGVTELGECCFQDCKDLRYVGLPEGLKSIPDDAFSQCESLDGIVIPASVTEIGYASFFGCTSLQSINIPAAVTKIEVGAFVDCDSLNAVHITDLDAWCRIEFETFFHEHPHFFEGASPLRYAKNLYLNGELVTEVVVPDDVTVLSGSVFAGCESLQKVTLPEGLKTIGQASFWGCTALTELRIPASVENVEMYAFGDCTSLETLYIESPVLIKSKQNSFTYEVIWKDVADRILVPDTYGETDVGAIFDDCTYEGKQDGYSVFKTRKQDGYPIIEGSKHTNLDVREDACSRFTKCLDCGFVLRDFQQHGQVRWEVVKEPTYDEEGLKELLCVDCGAWFGDQVIPRLEKPEEGSEPEENSEQAEFSVEESSEPEENSEQAESSAEESSEQTEPSAEESTVTTFSAESSAMASLTEISAPADDMDFPVGIVIVAVLLLTAGGVTVWLVRKKA